MKELDYYENLMDIVEQGRTYDAGVECDHMRANMELIRNIIHMRMVADPVSMLNQQHDLKLRCCELLLKVYGLKLSRKTVTSESDYSSRLMRNMVILTMTSILEDLFLFFRNYSEISAKDL